MFVQQLHAALIAANKYDEYIDEGEPKAYKRPVQFRVYCTGAYLRGTKYLTIATVELYSDALNEAEAEMNLETAMLDILGILCMQGGIDAIRRLKDMDNWVGLAITVRDVNA